MKVTINVQTGKGNKSTTKEINKTVDIIENISEFVELQLKRRMKETKCYRDGTSAVFEKRVTSLFAKGNQLYFLIFRFYYLFMK